MCFCDYVPALVRVSRLRFLCFFVSNVLCSLHFETFSENPNVDKCDDRCAPSHASFHDAESGRLDCGSSLKVVTQIADWQTSAAQLVLGELHTSPCKSDGLDVRLVKHGSRVNGSTHFAPPPLPAVEAIDIMTAEQKSFQHCRAVCKKLRNDLLLLRVPQIISSSSFFFLGINPNVSCRAHARRGFQISFRSVHLLSSSRELSTQVVQVALKAKSVHIEDIFPYLPFPSEQRKNYINTAGFYSVQKQSYGFARCR